MARGITEKDVWTAADALLLEGRRPTVEGVRQKIGRGSPNTVTPYLDNWFKGLGRRLQDPGAFSAPQAVPEPIAAAAQHFWEAALAAARHEGEKAFISDRQQLTAERDELSRACAQFAEDEVKLEARRRALDEAMDLAKSQLSQAQAQVLALEERNGMLEHRCERLLEESRRTQATLDAEREAAAEHMQRVGNERAAELARHEAAEHRWLIELDQARQAVNTAAAQAENKARALATEREARTALQEALRARETELMEAAAQATARAHAAEARLGTAQKSIADFEARLLAAAQRHADEARRLNEQLDLALQAVGRSWPKIATGTRSKRASA